MATKKASERRKLPTMFYAEALFRKGIPDAGIPADLGLKQCAEVFLEYLPKCVTHLLTIGTSGCALASAMLVLSKRPLGHVSIRKSSDESPHQKNFVGKFDKDRAVFAIVDDLVVSGNTVDKLLNWAELNGAKVHCLIVNRGADRFKDKLNQVMNVEVGKEDT